LVDAFFPEGHKLLALEVMQDTFKVARKSRILDFDWFILAFYAAFTLCHNYHNYEMMFSTLSM